MANGESICLIDGSGYIFRAFYALPMMNRPDGTPVNAVYGFVNMLSQLMQKNRCSHILVVFDAARQNFRNEIYPAYKATRKETPEELIPQFPLIRQACSALNIPSIELNGYEADDIIATYARLAVEQGFDARIISADKDLMQLMRNGVTLYDPMKKKNLSQEDVIKKFGVTSDKVVAVQSLMGDSTDNVPGAVGIGPKSAAELINQFGSLENIFTHIDTVEPKRRKEILLRDKEQIFISEKLVRLNENAPVPTNLSAYAARAPKREELKAFLSENDFKSLLAQIDDHFRLDKSDLTVAKQTEETPLTVEESPKEPQFTLIENAQQFSSLLDAQKASPLAFRLFTDSKKSLSGAALCFDESAMYYVPLITRENNQTFDLFATREIQKGVSHELFLKKFIERFNNPAPLIGCDVKNELHLIEKHLPKSISFQSIQDVALEIYVYQGVSGSLKPEDMAKEYFNEDKKFVSSLLGSGKTKIPFESIPLEQKGVLCAQEAHLIFRLHQSLSKALRAQGEALEKVYTQIDLPLTGILFQMERAGILVDKARLKELDKLFTDETNRLTNLIYELGGEEFNINSPAQVGYILFEKMGLQGGKKNQSGGFSTDVKALTELAENGVEIAQKILDYRLYAKLKSTYIDALIGLADKDMRVHTTFLQTATNTGRLASVDPNLQNIPVRTNAGKEIRRAFIAKEGYKIVCADYSQIELKLMAHVAQVKELQASFLANEDIHTRTAAQIFNVPANYVDSDMRRNAKAINFGIIYGMSAFGLAGQLKIPRADAKKYIDSYFAHYPEIQDYMRATVQFAERHGYVETLFKRRCPIAQIRDSKMKSFAARAAINAPIQGAAADIIKLAMNAVQKKLSQTNLDVTLLLQVHDELVFEVKESDVAAAVSLIKEAMETVVTLSVPLTADVKAGANWKEAH